MNNKTLLDRPALTAIAAALALASTPAWAQETPGADVPSADVAVTPATTTPEPVVIPQSPMDATAPAPMLPPIAMPSPAPQAAPATVAPVAVVTPQLPEVEAQPAARIERARQVVARTASTERAERTPASTRPAPAPPLATAPATPPTAQPTESPVLQAPMLTPSDLRSIQQRQQAEAQVAAAPEMAAPPQDNTAYWVMGAGGAALVLGFGAMAFMRRRTPTVDARESTVTWTEPVVLSAAPQAKRAVAHAAPRARAKTSDADFDKLEAMAAKKPTVANPFVTRAKRLRRANFILNNDGHAPADFIPAPTPVEAVKAPAAATPIKEHQKQPVFSYGKKPASARPTGRKLATT